MVRACRWFFGLSPTRLAREYFELSDLGSGLCFTIFRAFGSICEEEEGAPSHHRQDRHQRTARAPFSSVQMDPAQGPPPGVHHGAIAMKEGPPSAFLPPVHHYPAPHSTKRCTKRKGPPAQPGPLLFARTWPRGGPRCTISLTAPSKEPQGKGARVILVHHWLLLCTQPWATGRRNGPPPPATCAPLKEDRLVPPGAPFNSPQGSPQCAHSPHPLVPFGALWRHLCTIPSPPPPICAICAPFGGTMCTMI